MSRKFNKNDNDEFKYTIRERLGVITKKQNGWSKELNLVCWFDKEPAKYDIREWSPDHSHMSRGITMYSEEMDALVKLYQQHLEDNEEFAVAERKREEEARREAQRRLRQEERNAQASFDRQRELTQKALLEAEREQMYREMKADFMKEMAAEREKFRNEQASLTGTKSEEHKSSEAAGETDFGRDEEKAAAAAGIDADAFEAPSIADGTDAELEAAAEESSCTEENEFDTESTDIPAGLVAESEFASLNEDVPF